jgi:DMSO reductase anchor subunit
MKLRQYITSKKFKEYVLSFVFGAIIGYFALFLIVVIKDFASWKQIIIPSFILGIIISIWKDKFVNIFLEIISWF